ncbi:hypothetical protein BDZ94DRAFT_1201167, partial [Collybia nuda]
MMALSSIAASSFLDCTLHTSYKFFISSPLLVSFTGLILCFFFASLHYKTTKQKSWIVTTISSFVMSIASLPFVWDYVLGGGSVLHIRTLPVFAAPINRFFQSYLAADLILGTFFYRSRLSFVEGWIHHSIYILVVELAIQHSWPHIFCLCASMEIPTFILGLTTLHPRLRNNSLFASSFFATRIVFHIILTVAYFSEETRVAATGGSFIPAILLALVFPLHVVWFIGCIKGFIRRAAEVQQVQSPPIINLEIISVAAAPPTVPELSTPARGPRGTDLFPVPFPRFSGAHHHLRSFENILEKFHLDAFDARLGELWFW